MVAAMTDDEEVDVLVIGAGVAGMTTALIASLEGLRALVLEKTDQVGGTTSTSGGTTWIPGTHLSEKAGVPDSAEDAAVFLKTIVGARGGDDLRAAFLQSGRAAIEQLDRSSEVKFAAASAHPDYIDGPGAALGGRALGPVEFDGRLLGRRDFARVRPPRSEFLGLGGMMVGRNELAALLNRYASFTNFRTTLQIVGRYGLDRLRYRRGTRLLMGNALVARLLFSLRKQNVPIEFGANTRRLLVEGGRVTGVELTSGKVFRATRGVVLATGGVGWNKQLRERWFPEQTRGYALAPTTNVGEGADLAASAGANLEDGGDSAALWMPCSSYRKSDGTLAVWPHILLDRAKPGLLAVNAKGARFVNESVSYHDFSMGQIAAGAFPAHLVCDDTFIRRYGLGLVLPGASNLGALIKAGYIKTAPDLGGIAQKIGCDASGLASSVADYNLYARTGVDEAFARGSSVMSRFNGDASVGSNPCLGPIGTGPFYSVEIRPSDLASSAGLSCDTVGRVLASDGRPIDGLFACGNDMASIFRGTYPGPGTTIGPAIVFAWRIAHHLAGRLAP